jgi:hypothetical protein
VPALPDFEHEWHAAVHAASQHTPSARKPVRHWLAVVAGVPFASRATQLPLAESQ